MNPVYESATFWIRSPEWKFFNTLWIRKRLDVKSRYFLSGHVTRSSPVCYSEYCTSFLGSLEVEQDANFARFTTHALLPTFPRVLVKSESGYVWTGKFNLNTDCVFSHDVMAAIFVSQNNETAAMFVSQTNPVGVELFSYVNASFCSNKFA